MTYEEKKREVSRSARLRTRPVPILPFPTIPETIRKRASPESREAYLTWGEEIDRWRKSLMLDVTNEVATAISSVVAPPTTVVQGKQGLKGDKGDDGGFEFEIQRIEVWIAKRTDGKAGQGVEIDPYDGSTQEKLDTLFRSFPAYTTINLGPGVFLTNGGNEQNQIKAFEWAPKTGWRIRGAGIGATTLKLVNVEAGERAWCIYNGIATYGLSNDIEVSDLTLDANQQNNGATACGGVSLFGNGHQMRRLEIVNWGSNDEDQEAFGLSLGGPIPYQGDWTGGLVEEIYIDEPYTELGAFHPVSFMVFGGGVNDKIWSNSTITRSGSTATVTVSQRHNFKPGQWFRMRGATQSQYNGNFQVLAVLSAFQFTYTVTGSPASPATGAPEAQHPPGANGNGTGMLNGLIVRDCYIYGGLSAYSQGISVAGVHGAIFDGNTITDCHSAFYLDTSSARSAAFINNVVTRCEHGWHMGLGSDGQYFEDLLIANNLIELLPVTSRPPLEVWTKYVNTLFPGNIPFAWRFTNAETTRPHGFGKIVIRDNIVRFVGGAEGSVYPTIGLYARGVDSLLVQHNIIDLSASQLLQVDGAPGSIGSLTASGNKKSDGTIVLTSRDTDDFNFFDPDVELDRTLKFALV